MRRRLDATDNRAVVESRDSIRWERAAQMRHRTFPSMRRSTKLAQSLRGVADLDGFDRQSRLLLLIQPFRVRAQRAPGSLTALQECVEPSGSSRNGSAGVSRKQVQGVLQHAAAVSRFQRRHNCLMRILLDHNTPAPLSRALHGRARTDLCGGAISDGRSYRATGCYGALEPATWSENARTTELTLRLEHLGPRVAASHARAILPPLLPGFRVEHASHDRTRTLHLNEYAVCSRLGESIGK
jgi:hypothetical protein